MERTPVKSKVITSVGYDGDRALLEIEFQSGHIHQFLDVPAPIASWLLRVPEKGSFFARKIKNHFSFRDVTPNKEEFATLEQLRVSLN